MATRKSKASSRVSNISGISSIAISGFKSIAAETAIDVRPLTVLAGPNSSGKSSIMQPLLLLKQTLEAQYDPGSLQIDGAHVKFTKASEFLSKTTSSESAPMVMTIQVDGEDESTRLKFLKRMDGPIEVSEMIRKGLLRFDRGRPLIREWQIAVSDSSETIRKSLKALKDHYPFIDDKRAELSVVRDRCFLGVNASIKFEKDGPTGTFRVDVGMRGLLEEKSCE